MVGDVVQFDAISQVEDSSSGGCIMSDVVGGLIEPVRRGVYSGALGYLDVRGGLDLSVVIRTVLVKEGRAYVHVGGAVVADSAPIDEYCEPLDKARVLLDVLRGAREPDVQARCRARLRGHCSWSCGQGSGGGP